MNHLLYLKINTYFKCFLKSKIIYYFGIISNSFASFWMRSAMNEAAFTALKKHIRLYSEADNLKACSAFATTILFQITAIVLLNSEFFYLGWSLLALNSVRMFGQLHDMAHGSFFKSKLLNKTLGKIIGIYTFIPLQHWSDVHNRHHQVYGNIDKADASHTIICTKKQYQNFSPAKKIMVRFIREPIIFFLATYQFIWFIQSLYTNVVKYGFFSTVNFQKLMSIVLYFVIFPALGVSTIKMLLCLAFSVLVGTILFHLQHAVNEPYLERQDQWNPSQASLEGSTLLKIPFFLKPFTNGVQYHHIHHLSTRVPSYHLRECHQTFQSVPGQEDYWKDLKLNEVGYILALKSMGNTLYDEETKNYVPFSYEF